MTTIKKLLKNRTLMGALAIILSLLICFGLTPLYNDALAAKTEIVRVRSDILRGELITADRLEVVEVGAYNLPSNVLTSKDAVAGQYALTDLQRGDYVLSTKLSPVPLAEFEYLTTLDGSKQAMSITIKSFAAGLSGKLEPGDIVTLIASDYGDRGETMIVPELQYVYVMAVTASSGEDKDYNPDIDDERELPSTLTVLVCPTQAVVLADLETNGKIHAALVFRGDRETAQLFLDEQDAYIEELLKDEEEGDETDELEGQPADVLAGEQADGEDGDETEVA